MLDPQDLLDDAAAWLADQRPTAIQRMVADGERIVRRRPWPHAALALRDARAGSVIRVPFALVRPGQVQLSFHHVRSHVVKFIRRLKEGDDVNSVTRENMPGIVGPEGRSVVLRDRNHNFAGLLALIGWISREAAAGEFAPAAIADLVGALDEEDGPSVAVRVQDNFAQSTVRAFRQAMTARLFLERIDGTRTGDLPDRFADLEDNPVRELVARARVKVRPTGAGTGARDFDVSVKDMPVWVKGPGAPEYVEFHVAKIVRRALEAAGRPYDGTRVASATDEDIMRQALLDAQADPTHESTAIFDQIVVVPVHLRDARRLRQALELDSASGAVRLKA